MLASLRYAKKLFSIKFVPKYKKNIIGRCLSALALVVENEPFLFSSLFGLLNIDMVVISSKLSAAECSAVWWELQSGTGGLQPCTAIL